MDSQLIESLYIRLAAPLQSWAGQAVTGNIVQTERAPTLTGLRGLIAGSLGAPRFSWPSWIDDVEFLIRVERSPYITDDFQTINPRTESTRFRRRLLIAQGQRVSQKSLVFTPDAEGGNSIVRRTYLADGEFLIRLTSDDHLDELEYALSSPKFVTYLGRKAFAPTFPFYLGRGSADIFREIPTLALDRDRSLTKDHFHSSQDGNDKLEQPPQERPVTVITHNAISPPQGNRSLLQVPIANPEDRIDRIRDLLSIRRIPVQ